jgi:hypothetical protein
LPVLPILLVLLAILTIVPVGQWLVEIIVRPVTITQLVDRRVGLSTQLVAVDGLALLVPFDSARSAEAGQRVDSVQRWYAVRDSLQERRMILVRSSIPVEALRTRTVIARVVDDPAAVSGARAGIAARGEVDPGANVEPRLLDEVDPEGRTIIDVGSVRELAERKAGDVVRIRLRVATGIASCIPRDDCRARRLADGIGSWDYLAADPAGDGWAVVRTRYPPSVAPFHGVGHHASNPQAVAELLGQPPVRAILGWGRVLEAAYVEHDLGLPIDHLWLGPILFISVSALLFVGLRVGYPRFRVRGLVRLPAATVGSVALPCRATGRITPPGLSPFEVSDAKGALSAASDGGGLLNLEVGRERREVAIPRALGGLGAFEIGDMVELRGSLPALQIGWFGSQVLLVFADERTRDAAATVVGRGR